MQSIKQDRKLLLPRKKSITDAFNNSKSSEIPFMNKWKQKLIYLLSVKLTVSPNQLTPSLLNNRPH